MNNRTPRLQNQVSLQDLKIAWADWILACEVSQHSKKTLEFRNMVGRGMFWFFERKGIDAIGTSQLRAFLAYVTNGHTDPGGRWGNPLLVKPVRPRTVKDYHGHMRTAFRFFVREGTFDFDPMERIASPISRADQIQPFSMDQFHSLLSAAKKGVHPQRDEAMLLLFLDTGMRSSELLALNVEDLDMRERSMRVKGKGNKYRTVYCGPRALRSVWKYLQTRDQAPESPLFCSNYGNRFTYSGLRTRIYDLGCQAGINGVRCSPHTIRHTFAINFLRMNGNIFQLQALLGHTNLQMTRRYVAIAEADIANAHRNHSPVEFLYKRKNS